LVYKLTYLFRSHGRITKRWSEVWWFFLFLRVNKRSVILSRCTQIEVLCGSILSLSLMFSFHLVIFFYLFLARSLLLYRISYSFRLILHTFRYSLCKFPFRTCKARTFLWKNTCLLSSLACLTKIIAWSSAWVNHFTWRYYFWGFCNCSYFRVQIICWQLRAFSFIDVFRLI